MSFSYFADLELATYTVVMSVEALLVCRDIGTLNVLRRSVEGMDFDLTPAASHEAARAMLEARKFDALIVDCDDLHAAADTVHSLRQGVSNRYAVVFAIIDGTVSVRDAFDLGANFVMEKPLSPERTQRSFRAAHGLIIRERRRYFRCAVDFPVTVYFGAMEMQASAEDLSEGGMALRFRRNPPQSGMVRMRFTLPGRDVHMEVRADIAWSEGTRAGVHFIYMPDDIQRDISSWIEEVIAEDETAPLFINASRGWSRLEK